MKNRSESVFDFKIGPAFLAVILMIIMSGAEFAYTQGQQAVLQANTKKATEKIEETNVRLSDKQNSAIERVVRVETIASTIQSEIAGISAKLDRLFEDGKLDKR